MSCTIERPTAVANAVTCVGLTVHEMDRAVDFYCQALDFQVVGDQTTSGADAEAARVVRLQLGDELIQLTEHAPPHGRPIPADSQSNDHWFQHVAIIVRDMEQAYRRLRRANVEHVSPRPQRLPDWNPNAAGIQAFYFRDPDGHVLEILQFPPDKGHRKWHRPGSELMLGIDHTAIVVADTERSLQFYRDRFGMAVAAASENYGPEQERLNNVPGARLRITALRTGSGPGIELLEYVAPRSGRPRPADAGPRDLIHWETHLAIADAAHATTMRDPDGHALLLVPQSRKE